MRFLENDDSTTIHFRQFNLSPKDKYPTFTICFTGTELYWNIEEAIFNRTELTPDMFGKMLKGQDSFSYQYNHTSMLYSKVPVEMTDHTIMDVDGLSLKVPEILTGLEYRTDYDEASIHNGSEKMGKQRNGMLFQVSYNTSETICYTRVSDDSLGTLRTYDWLEFDSHVFGNDKYEDVDLRVFVHHPYQLMRSFHRPVFRSKLGNRKKSANTDDFSKMLRITITKITTLRKRSGSNVPCDEQLVDDDAKFQSQLIKHINCTPVYWRRDDLPQQISQSKACLQDADYFIQEYKEILASYTQPCVQMEIFSKFDTQEENPSDNPRIMFMYEPKDYEEIQNTEDFDLESFVSGVGGFIGIFLGYSILQLPELLGSLTSLMSKLRPRKSSGRVCKRDQSHIELNFASLMCINT